MTLILSHTFRHASESFGCCLGLMRGLPLAVGHSVDERAAIVLGHPARFGDPIAKAVAAKTGQPHQINILRVGAMLQMCNEPPECRRRYGIFNLYL